MKSVQQIGPIKIQGKSQSLFMWAKEFNTPYQGVYRRWNQGIRDVNALFAPPAWKRKTKNSEPIELVFTDITPDITPDITAELPPSCYVAQPQANNPLLISAGDWVCWSHGPDLDLGIVIHANRDVVYTNKGPCFMDDIIEIRRKREPL